MEAKEFNLLREPWIKVLLPDSTEKKVSLLALFNNAHQYSALAGETETQNAAMLRLLLSVSITIMYRYNIHGDEILLTEDDDPEDFIDRWHDYWQLGQFPYLTYEKYLTKYEDRFWLFHDTYPFMQNAGLAYGSTYDAKSLFGDLKESNNKATRHHFSLRESKYLDRLEYDEAARWLIFLQNYSINIKAAKKDPNKPKISSQVGPLGSLGFIYIQGENIFETIMLNATLLKNGNEAFGNPNPIWERQPDARQGVKIYPDNLPYYYTMQCRRVELKRKNGFVTGFQSMIGEINSLDTDLEQMTIWHKVKGKDIRPKTHDFSKESWQEFPTIFDIEKSERQPGLIYWIQRIKNQFPKSISNIVNVVSVGQQYGNMSYFFDEIYYDSLSLSSDLLSDKGVRWIKMISNEVLNCQSVAKQINNSARDISKFLYGQANTNISNKLKSDYYFRINTLFKEWLLSIDPNTSDEMETITKWEKISLNMALKTVEEYVWRFNTELFEQREIQNKIYALPDILNKYSNNIYKIYPILKGEDHE